MYLQSNFLNDFGQSYYKLTFANLSGIMIQAFQRLSLTSTQYYTQISSSQFSQKLVDIRGFKRLDSLIITNFKSFRGKVYVGPLLDFTSIVGPNGAGKSNVLDALMFCFSNEKSKLTVSDIREFINREGVQTYNEMTKKNKYCEVQARFILENDRPFTLSRTLYPDQRQLFVIDGDEYPQKIYQNFLMKCNINYIASNFAIWQGEIDKLLNRNPRELTVHIENISGSVFFKKQYQELKSQIKEIDSYLENRSLRLVKLKQSKKTLKNMNNQKNNFMKIQQEYEQISRKIALLRSFRSDLEIKQYQNSIKSKERQEKQKIKQINEDKIRLQKQQSEKIQLQTKIIRLIKQISQNAAKLKSSEQFNNVIDAQTISELNKTIQNLKKYLQNLINRKNELQKQMSQVQSNDVNKEYLELYSRWQKQNQSINKQLSKRKDQYLYVLGILQTKKNIIDDYHQKQTKAVDLSKQEVKQKEQLLNSIQELQKVISQRKTQHSKLAGELSKNKNRRQQLMQKIMKKNQEIIQLQSLFTENIQNQKDKDLILKLNQIDGFQGSIQQRVSPSNKKYQICFQLMMGPILKYLLSLNETSSKQVSIKLKENYQMKNMVILKNVHERKQLVTRTILGKTGILAIDAVQFDKNITNFQLFLKQYLNGKIICDTMESAWGLLSQNIKGVKQIYTLDGNLIRSDGMVSSYGTIETTKHKYRYVDMAKNMSAIGKDIEHLKKQKIKLEEQLQLNKKKTNQDLLTNHSLQIQKLQSKKQELKMKLQVVKNIIQNKKEIKVPKGLQSQIEELQKRSKKLLQSMNQIEKQMLKSKIFSQFMKKNKISLENFRNLQDLSDLQGAIKLKNKFTKQFQQIDREVSKIKQQIASKEQKLQHLHQKVKSVISLDERQNFEKARKNKEAELAATRNQLAKISSLNVESLKFKSEVPQLIAKLQVMKERKIKMTKQELQSLGLPAQPTLEEYSKLDEQLGFRLQRASKERLQNHFEQLQKQKVQLQLEIQKNNISLPDARVEHENQERIQSEMERLSNQIKQHTERRNELTSKLQTVKAQRKSVFMNFIQQMRPILQNAYQMLTQKVGAAGKAQIYLQNQQFPCDYGIYYTPIPPLKKFVYDLDQLSGGQKSIASLALQYAITLTSKSPFLILDQTDAFLDSQNINRFKNLINHTLQNNRKLQLILITHKRSLFLSGKSLVGVTKFKDDPFSKAFSLKLQDSENPVNQSQIQ